MNLQIGAIYANDYTTLVITDKLVSIANGQTTYVLRVTEGNRPAFTFKATYKELADYIDFCELKAKG